MGLNYDISLKVLDNDGSTGIQDVKIHAYFNKVNSSSSDSKWNDDIGKTTGTGKKSFNLGDSSFLGSNGKIDNGDTILICAWLTNNNDTDKNDKSEKAPGITRCINFIHTVDTSSSSYEEKIILLDVTTPICNFNIPGVTNTGHNFTIENNSSINEGAFSVDSGEVQRSDLYQEIRHYSQEIFLGLEIEKTNYYLGEINEDKNAIEDYDYSYINAGDYSCIFTIYNFLGISCHSIVDYHILFNKPNVNFDFTFTKLLNTDKHIGVGDNDELKTEQKSSTNFGDTWELLNATFDWSITDLTLDGTDNGDEYLSKDENFEPTKLYKSSSDKEIILTLNWNDGFDSHQEILTKNPFLDVYNIKLKYNWTTQKNYQVDGIYIPLGDDDLVQVKQENFDIASQDYNSNSQWVSVKYNVIKKKNNGDDDSESLEIIASNGDEYTDIFSYYVRYYHDSNDAASINQQLVYWDGFENIEKNLKYDFVTEKYTINNDFHWDTLFYGLNKVVTMDTDTVTISNDTNVIPQNNIAILDTFTYNITKEKYTSYTDDTVIDDSEEFIFDDIDTKPEFNIGKDGDYNIKSTIDYYDGYQDVQEFINKTILSRVHIPYPNLSWGSRYGVKKYVEGRDDLVTFSNISIQKDFYGTEKDINSSRNLAIDWFLANKIITGNFSNPNVIGGEIFNDDNLNVEEYIGKNIDFEPEINYWSELSDQEVKIIFYYNDGFFNRDISLIDNIETKSYDNLIPNCTYTSSVPDRNTTIKFVDNSSSNENRIISTDWSLTDRYEDNSMNIDKRGTDNLQQYLDISKSTEIETTVNSAEDHILSQDEIRWDNGFNLVLFSKDYIVSTSVYNINPGFTYEQIFKTGPEIRFTNVSTKNDGAVLLDYSLEIEDKNNDGTNAFASYNNIVLTTTQDHTYKSVSNSPFEADVSNKEVTIFVDFDDGFNEVYDSYTDNILVKPNRISQSFITEPIRHSSDTEDSDLIITGNNPIKFYDNSSTERTDTDFIKHVEYIITETC